VKAEKSSQTIKYVLLMSILSPEDKSSDSSTPSFDDLMGILIIRHLLHTHTLDRGLGRCRPNRHRTIDNWIHEEAPMDFRFTQDQLKILSQELGFAGTNVKLSNGSRMPGEEILLRGLYELASGDIQPKISKEFGRDWTAQSRAFTYFIDYMYDHHAHLVHDNLDWWYHNGFWERSAAGIEFRMRERYVGVMRNMISHFIDCNCEEIAVPGISAAENGANAARWDDNIQRAFYNGWKSIHGIKHQTVENAFGFCEDIFGPESVRENDLTLLRLSNINGRFRST
jgi:hypothetical protein